MIVTKVTEITKSRVKVEVDDGFAFVLYKGELSVYGIKEGETLADAAYDKIMTDILPKRAKLRAMNLLKGRAYSAAALKKKLEEGGYPLDIVSQAIDYVSSFGYINDHSYAYDFIEYNKESKSKTRILTDLLKKGISGDVIEAAWEEAVGNDRLELEKDQIIRLMEKRHFSAETASFQEKQKMTAFLYRKGFSIETIRSALSLDITIN